MPSKSVKTVDKRYAYQFKTGCLEKVGNNSGEYLCRYFETFIIASLHIACYIRVTYYVILTY